MQSPRNQLLKVRLVGVLKEKILSGELQPAELIVEGRWAKRLGVAPVSVREALNTLASEGFVVKDTGQSAKVTVLSAEDVRELYELRAVLEGMAARLVAEKRPDLRDLDQAVADMSAAFDCRNLVAFHERDLRFHIVIAEKAGNRFLAQQIRWLLPQLFAFYVMRLHADIAKPWGYTLEEHRSIVEVLRTAEPAAAQSYVEGAIRGFFAQTPPELLASFPQRSNP